MLQFREYFLNHLASHLCQWMLPFIKTYCQNGGNDHMVKTVANGPKEKGNLIQLVIYTGVMTLSLMWKTTKLGEDFI